MYLRFYLKVSKADTEVENRAKFLAVLVVLAGEQLCYWPSTVAAVLVIFASLESSQEAFHQRVIKVHILMLRIVYKTFLVTSTNII